MKIDIKSISALESNKIYVFETVKGQDVDHIYMKLTRILREYGIRIVLYEQGMGKFISPKGKDVEP